MAVLDGFFGRIVESVTSQERRATQTDVCLTYALNRSVFANNDGFSFLTKTLFMCSLRYISSYVLAHLVSPYEKSDGATSYLSKLIDRYDPFFSNIKKSGVKSC